MEWHALHRILDLVTLHVGAPIRRGRKYREWEKKYFGDPETTEKYFASKAGGENIPPNYIEKFTRMCTRINEWIRNIHANDTQWTRKHWNTKKWVCDVVFVELQCGYKQVEILKVMVRPCAEQCGFWKRFLNAIRKEIQEYENLECFTIATPYETNWAILGYLGFEPTDIGDMSIKGSDLKRVRPWEPTQDLPTAEQLNDPAFVNRDLRHNYSKSSGDEATDEEVESPEVESPTKEDD